ncbi:hypothetical protein ACGFIF_02100 [Kribbella sp. NPDC049174]|uniref:hypothetical protein n=1 Tax=Kribbella sp. NPDC049174 TaxID=3364112 RepID=UPI00370FCF5A
MKTHDPSARPSLIRALIAVCLLAGVFVMHGLTGNHDAAAALTATPQPAAAGPASVHQAAEQPSAHSAHRVPDSPSAAGQFEPTPIDAAARSEITVRPAEDGHGHAMGDVCLAMLTALALAIAGALASRILRTTRPVVRLGPRLTPLAAGPSPPWLQPTLSKLCVLRS